MLGTIAVMLLVLVTFTPIILIDVYAESFLVSFDKEFYSVGDIELGKILNQINLECDNSKLTDIITYYDGMGPALYRLCNFESSLNFFNDSLIKDPENVEVLVNKGSTLGKLGYYSESIEYYNQAIKVNSEFLPAKNNKANALAYLGNEKEAIMIYEEILMQIQIILLSKKILKF